MTDVEAYIWLLAIYAGAVAVILILRLAQYGERE